MNVAAHHIRACSPYRHPGDWWFAVALREGVQVNLLDALDYHVCPVGIVAKCPCGCGFDLKAAFTYAEAVRRGWPITRHDGDQRNPTLTAALQCPTGSWWRLVAGQWVLLHQHKPQPEPDFMR
jgi:hypothetical protein